MLQLLKGPERKPTKWELLQQGSEGSKSEPCPPPVGKTTSWPLLIDTRQQIDTRQKVNTRQQIDTDSRR